MSYGKKDGKAFRLGFDVSGVTKTDVFALLDAVPSDDEDYLDGVMNDSDTEFVPLSFDADAAATDDIVESNINDDNTAGPSIREAVHLDAVVHSYVTEEPVIQEPVPTKKRKVKNPKFKPVDKFYWSSVMSNLKKAPPIHAKNPEQISFHFPTPPSTDPAAFFLEYCDYSPLCKNISRESIRYALQKGAEFDVLPREIEVFFSLIFFMGLVVRPSYRDYWRTDELGDPFVRDTMSRKRFEEILRFLHFNDNFDKQAEVDKCWKVRMLIDHFNYVYRRYTLDTREQSIDEHMIKFKGHHSAKQYIKNKPIKWGFKVWQRCDSRTGYLFEFSLYTGKKGRPEVGLGESVVLDLTESLEGSGTSIIADNYFSSPHLALKLYERGILFTGVTKPERKGMPTFRSTTEMQRGDSDIHFSSTQPMVVVKWLDNKPVHVVTTKVLDAEQGTALRRKKGKKEKVAVSCPSVIQYYNRHMGGVDLHDRLKVAYGVDRRSKCRFYLRLAFDFFDQCMVNSWIAYNDINKDAPLDSKEYRFAVAKGIVAGFSSRCRAVSLGKAKTRSKKLVVNDLQDDAPESSASPMLRTGLEDLHLPKALVARKRCCVCYKNGKDVKASFGCVAAGCTGGFCLNKERNCFFLHHAGRI